MDGQTDEPREQRPPQYAGICAICDAPIHVQAMRIDTVMGEAHQACALRLEQRASRGTQR